MQQDDYRKQHEIIFVCNNFKIGCDMVPENKPQPENKNIGKKAYYGRYPVQIVCNPEFTFAVIFRNVALKGIGKSNDATMPNRLIKEYSKL